MTRPLRIEFPGAFYHVTARGNADQTVFHDDLDRTAFLEVLASVVERFGWRCFAYCLMGNHYHLLIETPEPNLGRGMRQLGGVFTQRFNRRHARTGHLFQGRYKAILVDRDEYLLELCRYVVLNPVRAGMVRGVRDWRWSSYRATAGQAPAPAFLTTDWVLEQFGKRRKRAQTLYRDFVREGRNAEAPWQDLKGQVLLGGEKFVEKMRPLLAGAATSRSIPHAQRHAARPTLNSLFKSAASRRPPERDARILKAVIEHLYVQAEVARYLGLHEATVSRIVKRMMLETRTRL